MKLRKISLWAGMLALATTAMTAVGVGSAVASPAARSLPAGNAIYTISCGNPRTVSLINVETGASITVGTPSADGQGCATGGSVDPLTGTIYYTNVSAGNRVIRSINTSTGATSAYLTLTGDITSEFAREVGIAMGRDGAMYLAGGHRIYSVDRSTGVTTAIHTTVISWPLSFTVDPVSGIFYAMDTNGTDANGNFRFYRIVPHGINPVVELEAVNLHNGCGTGRPTQMQVDSSGTFWVMMENGSNDAFCSFELDHPNDTLAFGANVDWAITGQAMVLDRAPQAFMTFVDPDAPVVVSEPLANTGADLTGMVTTALSLLVLGGGLTLFVRRRTTSASSPSASE